MFGIGITELVALLMVLSSFLMPVLVVLALVAVLNSNKKRRKEN